MDKPSAQTQVHLSTTYSHVIKDIENLEQFYEAKVLAILSTIVSEKPAVSFGSKPTKPASYMYSHPDSDSSDWSWFPGRDERPDTPKPETPQQAKAWLQEMWVNPR